jgi:hypothetical protein
MAAAPASFVSPACRLGIFARGGDAYLWRPGFIAQPVGADFGKISRGPRHADVPGRFNTDCIITIDMFSTKSSELTMTKDATDTPSFRFQSFGVNVEVTSDDSKIVARAAEVARRSLLGRLREIKRGKIDHRFELTRSKSGTYTMIQNGERMTYGRSAWKFYKFFDSLLRVAIGEYSPERVFMHAGVVGWQGKAILLPGDSFAGKSTLVAALVRCGAEYFSDDFALLDTAGLVHSFPRPLAMRADDGMFSPYELTVEELSGTVADKPLPVGCILFTNYKPGARWSPKTLSAGEGVLKMIPFTLPISYRPEFAFRVLNIIAPRAIIASGSRGNAEKFAKTLLNFVDKHVN